MKILILGATGACGEQITRKAITNGHQVTAFVRNAGKLSQDLAPKVQVITLTPSWSKHRLIKLRQVGNRRQYHG